ncbi:hypothetical protein BDW72DRAFT_195990 [Aspergillus terricola var. indicus]
MSGLMELNRENRHAEKESEQPYSSQNGTTADPKETGRAMRGFRWLVVCVSLYMTCFLYGLNTTIAADVQGPVIKAFSRVEQLAWIGAGFPMGSVCIILLLGNLFNIFNMKWVYIATVVLFESG